MCGIYGFQARKGFKLTAYEGVVLTMTLAAEMEQRGRDSYGGVVWQPPDAAHKLHIYRDIGRVTDSAPRFFKDAGHSQAMFGHTRAATVGAVSVHNCHPFAVGDILGAHNGGIANHRELNEKYKRDFQVDSPHIFAHLNEDKSLAELDGIGTVVFTRESEGFKKIYLARSMAGQLSVCKLYRDKSAKRDDPTYCAIVFASTYEAIRRVCHQLDYEFFPVDTEPKRIYALEDGEVTDTGLPFDLGYLPQQTKFEKWKEDSKNRHHHSGRGGYFMDEDTALHEMIKGYKEGKSWDYEQQMWRDEVADKRAQKASSEAVQRNKQNQQKQQSHYKIPKKQRKLRAKHRNALMAERLFMDATVQPTADNLMSMDRFPKFHVPTENRVGGNAERIPICPQCTCSMRQHVFGWCRKSFSNSCKSVTTESCLDIAAKCCRDCGCFMVTGVHELNAAGDVRCITCKCVCRIVPDYNVSAPKSQKVDEAEERAKQQEEKQQKLLLEATTTTGSAEGQEVLEAELVDKPGKKDVVIVPYSETPLVSLRSPSSDPLGVVERMMRTLMNH